MNVWGSYDVVRWAIKIIELPQSQRIYKLKTTFSTQLGLMHSKLSLTNYVWFISFVRYSVILIWMFPLAQSPLSYISMWPRIFIIGFIGSIIRLFGAYALLDNKQMNIWKQNDHKAESTQRTHCINHNVALGIIVIPKYACNIESNVNRYCRIYVEMILEPSWSLIVPEAFLATASDGLNNVEAVVHLLHFCFTMYSLFLIYYKCSTYSI